MEDFSEDYKIIEEKINILETKRYEDYIENYLKGIYGAKWNKEKLVYKKY